MTQIEAVLALVNEYANSAGVELVHSAYSLSLALCSEQELPPSTPNAVAQGVEAAHILADLKARAETVATALLAGLPEDRCPPTLVAAQVSDAVSELVEGVRRMRQLPYLSSTSRPTWSGKRRSELYHAFVATLESPQLILVELAHQVNRLRHLSTYFSPDQRSIVFDAMEIYAPLAHRLGIWRLKSELEDRAFQFTHPEEFFQISGLLSDQREQRESALRQVADQLRHELAGHGIDAEVTGRPKHLYSIFRKMHRKGVPLEAVYDIRALRVLVNTEADCYRALSAVHGLWTPVPDQYDDYVANPKPNGYQSLHTAVLDDQGASFEVQIRTREMHQSAELGVAAHWRYKERQSSKQLPRKRRQLEAEQAIEDKISWLRMLLDEEQDADGDHAVVAEERDATAGEPVFVFTPAGDVIRLPAGATPIDFAYRVHTELGHRCSGAKVNGQIVPLDRSLVNGDRVEILTRKQSGPNVNWLSKDQSFVKTREARKKISAWFRTQRRAKDVARGHEILDRELTKLGLTSLSFDQIADLFRLESSGELLAQIGSGLISSDRMHSILTAQPRPSKEEQAREAEEELVFEVDETKTVIEREPEAERRAQPRPRGGPLIASTDGLFSRLAKCCYPVPAEAIVGYVTRGYGATIHVADCPNVTSIHDRHRIVPAEWGETNDQTFPVMVMVEAINRRGLLGDIGKAVAKEKVDIHEAKAQRRSHWAIFELLLEVGSADQLDRVLKKLSDAKGVRMVYRRKG